MNSIISILNRSVAYPFFRAHAGAFLFLFFLLFGIHPSLWHMKMAHYSFIVGILTSMIFFLVTLGCWSLYCIKIILFFRSCLLKESYDFLFTINAIHQRKRFLLLLRLNILLLSPLIGYGLVILYIAIRDRYMVNGILVSTIIILLCLLTTLFFYIALRKAKTLQEISRGKIRLPVPNILSGFLLRYIFKQQFIPVTILKLISFTSLYYFVRTDSSVFEQRMLWLLYITLLVGHSILIYKNFHFVEKEMSFYRNLPVKKIITLLSLLLVYVIIMLPEIWALRGMAITQHNTADYIWMVLTGPSVLLLMHSLLYTEDMKMEEFLKLLFGIWIVFVFFSLSRNHWLLPAIAITFSTIIFLMSYPKYEKNTMVQGLE